MRTMLLHPVRTISMVEGRMAAESAPSREETNSLWIAFSGALSGRSICIRPAIPAASGSPRACRRRGDPRPFAFGGGERRKEGGRSRDSWPRHRAFRERPPGLPRGAWTVLERPRPVPALLLVAVKRCQSSNLAEPRGMPGFESRKPDSQCAVPKGGFPAKEPSTSPDRIAPRALENRGRGIPFG